MNFNFFDIKFLTILLGFVIITVSSNQIAKFFQKHKLPLISGLIFTGILAGPYVTGLLDLEAKDRLFFINETALSFIAFAAGAELYLRELRSRIRSIKWNTFGHLVITFIMGVVGVFFLSDYIPYMRDLNSSSQLGIALITGVIFVARSPASAIAIINELRAKGPFVQTVMGVTVLKDFLVIILFSICLSISNTLISHKIFDILEFFILLADLTLSFIIGFYFYGLLLKLVLRSTIQKNAKTFFVLLIGYSSYLLAKELKIYSLEFYGHTLSLEPLLMCILASLYVTNFTRYRPEFLKILEDISVPIYALFFTFTGATLSVNVIVNVIGVAFMLFALRMVTMVIGGYTGGLLARDPMKFNHVGWMAYVTQAGVALGLTTIISKEFPGWGEQFATVIIALIVINQFVGPPLFKFAVFRVGENRNKAPTQELEGLREAIIVGYESQSVALAHQLVDKGWNVQLATKKEEGSFQAPKDIKIVYIKDVSEEEFRKMDAHRMGTIITMLSDEENLEICDMAYHKFGTKDLVTRLNHRNNSESFLNMGVKIVDPSTAIVSLLDHFVRSPQAASLLLGMKKGQDSRDVQLRNPDLHGILLRDLRLPSDVIILSVVRDKQTIITHGYTRLRINDTITAVGSIKSLNNVQLKFDK